MPPEQSLVQIVKLIEYHRLLNRCRAAAESLLCLRHPDSRIRATRVGIYRPPEQHIMQIDKLIEYHRFLNRCRALTGSLLCLRHTDSRIRSTPSLGQGFLLLVLWLFSPGPMLPVAIGQDSTDGGATSENQEETEQKPAAQSKVPPGREYYLGREIAQTMHYAGADWLIRDEREREERCSMMLANLGLKNGMTVCDMGCGNGFHTLKIAELIGESGGSVFAVDVQPMMLKLLRDRMEEQGAENIVPILGSFHNPHLPANSIDMILLVDVYHEFSHPVHMLSAMKKSLKKNGLLALVEFRAEDESVPIKPLHKMSKQQIDKEMTANGFKLVKEFDRLPWQHMMFYGKTEPQESKPK